MKTKITELFGIKYPIILPGMSWISTPELVAAVCNAGGIGWLATGPLSVEETRKSIERIRELTDKPFGAGATLLMPGAKENAELMLEMEVPVINVSLGKCDWIAERAQKYNGKVIQTVVNLKHAHAAQKYGADAVQLTGNEAAAHGGDVTTFCLIPAAKEQLDIPVVAIGGIADGKGMAAALALGADGVGMGTRLATTTESPLHDITKKAHVDASVDDTLFSNRFDGLWCRVLNTPSSRKSIKQGMNLFKAALVGPRIAKDLNLPLMKVMLGIMAEPQKMTTLAHMATAFDKIKAATADGDFKKGVGLVGQCTGIIHDIPTCKEVIDRTVKEAKAVSKNLAATIK